MPYRIVRDVRLLFPVVGNNPEMQRDSGTPGDYEEPHGLPNSRTKKRLLRAGQELSFFEAASWGLR
jgi:hypothetical protein